MQRAVDSRELADLDWRRLSEGKHLRLKGMRPAGYYVLKIRVYVCLSVYICMSICPIICMSVCLLFRPARSCCPLKVRPCSSVLVMQRGYMGREQQVGSVSASHVVSAFFVRMNCIGLTYCMHANSCSVFDGVDCGKKQYGAWRRGATAPCSMSGAINARETNAWKSLVTVTTYNTRSRDAMQRSAVLWIYER